MNRTLINIAIVTFGAVVAIGVFAQARHDEKPHGVSKPTESTSQVVPGPSTGGRNSDGPHAVLRVSTTGVVKGIDVMGKKVTLDHAAVKRLNLDASTHEFGVKNAKSLETLKEGDKVTFTLEESGSNPVVVQIAKQKAK